MAADEAGPSGPQARNERMSAFKSLGWLDRFLAVWILLAMAIGVLLGNFVPETGPALQKGKFVGVSVPIAVGLLVMMYPIVRVFLSLLSVLGSLWWLAAVLVLLKGSRNTTPGSSKTVRRARS
jgi:ACR3 family arsenite efflux pump ArsB